MVDYKHSDLMASIAKVYKNNEDFILSELNIPWIKKVEFTGDFSSPREYNFSTDTLNFTIEVDYKELKKAVLDLKENKEFAEYLRENYTSYDGFWSYTPNNWSDLWTEISTEGSEFTQSVGALIQFLAQDAIRPQLEFYSGIEGQIYEDWRGNGYGDLNYQICDHKSATSMGCKATKCFNYYS
jgi:hypothetical protein